MNEYLMIESRDPFESKSALHGAALALGLQGRGHRVTIYLVQNAVLAARAGASAENLRALLREGVTVLADDMALAERSIRTGDLAPGVRAAPIDLVVEALMRGCKTFWH